MDSFEYWAEGAILTGVSSFGILCNLSAIHVFVKQSNRYDFSRNLFGLAVFDTGFLVMSLLTMGIRRLSPLYYFVVFVPVSYFFFGLIHIFRVGSVCMNVGVNLERFSAVLYPMRPMRWRRYFFGAVVLLSTVYNLPKFFEFMVKRSAKSGIQYIATTSLRRNKLYFKLYVFWSKVILFELIPYLVVMVCNISIIVRLRNYLKPSQSEEATTVVSKEKATAANYKTFAGSGKNSSGNTENTLLHDKQENHHLGFALIGISTFFILCQCLKIYPDFIELIGHSFDERYAGEMSALSHLFLTLNSTLNFFIYYVSGKKFREAWAETYSTMAACCYKISYKNTKNNRNNDNGDGGSTSKKNNSQSQEWVEMSRE